MLESKPGTLGTETLQLSLNVNKSQLNSVTIFDNIVKLAKDKEMVNDFRSNAEGELIINKGALS
jgi:hypothetical protein